MFSVDTNPTPGADILEFITTPARAVRTLRAVLDWIDTLERGGWRPQALAAEWPHRLRAPGGAPDLRPAEARRALAAELKLIQSWLRAAADGQPSEIPVPHLQVSLLTLTTPGDERIALRLPPDYEPPPAHVLRVLVAVALRLAVLARCARPGCARVFPRPVGQGRPPRFCSTACAQADRTHRWRHAHRETFRQQRRDAYARRVRRALPHARITRRRP